MLKSLINKAGTFIQKKTAYFEQMGDDKNKIYIVPTKLGIFYIGVTFASFMIGLVYTNNMTLLVTFLLVSFLVISMVLTNNQLLSAKFEKINIVDFYSNEKGQGEIFVSTSTKTLSSFLKLELKELNTIITLEPTQEYYTFRIKLSRGHHLISRIKIFSESPAGLFHAWSSWKVSCSFYVYPKPKEIVLSAVMRAKETNSISEEADFSHHILYQRGMNAKKINWRNFARTNQLYWKKHEQISQDHYNFDLEMMPGNLETKLEHLSFLIQLAHSQGSNWSLKVYQDEIQGIGYPFYKQSMQLISGVKQK